MNPLFSCPRKGENPFYVTKLPKRISSIDGRVSPLTPRITLGSRPLSQSRDLTRPPIFKLTGLTDDWARKVPNYRQAGNIRLKSLRKQALWIDWMVRISAAPHGTNRGICRFFQHLRKPSARREKTEHKVLAPPPRCSVGNELLPFLEMGIPEEVVQGFYLLKQRNISCFRPQ